MLTITRISSLRQFMSLSEGQKLETASGTWEVILAASKGTAVPKIVIQRPGSSIPEEIFYDEKNNEVIDTSGKRIDDLSVSDDDPSGNV